MTNDESRTFTVYNTETGEYGSAEGKTELARTLAIDVEEVPLGHLGRQRIGDYLVMENKPVMVFNNPNQK